MKTQPIFLIVILLLIFFFADAQVSSYTFSQSVASYGAPNSGTFVGFNPQDDDVTSVPLPFTFTFNNTPYNSVNVCSNGFLSFAPIIGTEYFPISDPGTQEVIAPFGQDLLMAVIFTGDITAGSNSVTNVSFPAGLAVGDSIMDYNGDFNTQFPIITQISGSTIVLNTTAINSVPGYFAVAIGGSIKQMVTGTTPNRICEFEFKNFTRFSVFDEVINFKVKLYETSNRIEFVYGNCVPGMFGTSSEVGLKGASQADFNTRTLNGLNNWVNSNPSVIITDSCEFSQQFFPPTGLTYAWEPGCTVPPISIAQSNTLICAGQSVTLTASGASTYTWDNGANTASVVLSPTISTTYTLAGTDAGCTGIVTITQNVAALPNLSITASSSVTCAGESLTLTASGAASYSWSGNGSGSQITVNPIATTIYTLSASDGTCQAEKTITHSVNVLPQVSVTPSPAAICPGQSATLSASGAQSYSWTSGQTSSQIVVSPAATTVYSLTATNEGCSKTFSVTLTVSTCNSLPENNQGTRFSVYPNPFSDKLYIRDIQPGSVISISDALGKKIHESTVNENQGAEITTADLKPGMYFITVTHGNESNTRKLIRD